MAINWKARLRRTGKFDYDQWLEYFRKNYKARDLIDNQDELEELLPPDGYAALKRWLEIFENPSRMDKLYKGKLDRLQEEDIMDVAIGDDDEAIYIALIRKNVKQLESSSTQEVARLSQNINIFRDKLKEIRSRKPKAGSTLERVLAAAEKKPAKKSLKTAKLPKKPVKKRKVAPSEAVESPKTKKTGSKSSKAKK